MMGVRGTALVGLIPRISNLLFYTITKTPDREFFVEGSFLEIYNEKLRDLLDKKGNVSVVYCIFTMLPLTYSYLLQVPTI
jgi:hypothetical protein